MRFQMGILDPGFKPSDIPARVLGNDMGRRVLPQVRDDDLGWRRPLAGNLAQEAGAGAMRGRLPMRVDHAD